MKDVTGLLVVVLTSLMGPAGGIEPNSGYCLGNQCFAVFQDPSDFTTAQDHCRNEGGHLMTVRSSVSHDVLLILLGNFTGRFWIGLHLTTGCPDAALKLRGFQWVTKDSESDFDNWTPSFNSSCSSHRCVSVSREDECKWIQEPCGEDAAGFLCEYSFHEPCESLAVAEGESVTYMTPMRFGGEGVLSLPPGSTAVRKPAKIKYVCSSEQWLQAPWSCEIHNGGCEYKCTAGPKHVSSCSCPPGQTVNPTNKVTCDVATEDPCLPLRCAHNCHKSGDSYACMCDHGYKLAQDGRSCEDLDECVDKRQCPGKNFICVNSPGGFQCVCKEGYKLTGDQCIDMDQCMSAPCEHICVDTPGSYQCSCYVRYKPDPKSPNKCILYCEEEECEPECDPNDSSECNCPEGYVLDERDDDTRFCIDIDECAGTYCEQGCKNTFGSYVCTCSPGYTLVDLYKCVKNGDHTDTGTTTIPNIPTTPPVPFPGPTRQPSAVTVGGLVGIIVCSVFVIVLVVFLVHRIANGREKTESAGEVKAPEGEAHGLHQVASDA